MDVGNACKEAPKADLGPLNKRLPGRVCMHIKRDVFLQGGAQGLGPRI